MKKVPAQAYKFLGLFSTIRGYNILLLLIAQYLSAIFVFSVDKTLEQIFLDLHLHFIVIATICTVSSGYIINDFYDGSIDAINKPMKTHMGTWVSKKTKLRVYFFLNILAFLLSIFISWKAAAFFSTYIFLIWFYSHKLQKKPLLRIISVSILDILPFFVVLVYYNNMSPLILMHGIFLFGLIVAKEIIKDFERTKGAVLIDRQTLVTKYSRKNVKLFLYLTLITIYIPIYYMLQFPEIGAMKYYFYFYLICSPIFCYYLIIAKSFKEYLRLHNMLKVLLVIGVFSLSLIDTSTLLIRLLNQFNLL